MPNDKFSGTQGRTKSAGYVGAQCYVVASGAPLGAPLQRDVSQLVLWAVTQAKLKSKLSESAEA